MTGAHVQLALALDPRRDDLTAGERAAAEAVAAEQRRVLVVQRRMAPTCRCTRPWGVGLHCVRCGRDVEAR